MQEHAIWRALMEKLCPSACLSSRIILAVELAARNQVRMPRPLFRKLFQFLLSLRVTGMLLEKLQKNLARFSGFAPDGI